jgi:hypothetical protein
MPLYILYQIRILLEGGKKLNKDKLIKAVVMIVIVLFISLSGLNSVTSKDISISDDKILKDNNVIEQMDNNKEIITHISGYVGLNYCEWEGILLKKVEIWTMDNPYCYIEITGYKKPLFPLDDSKFNANPTHIIAEQFFGFIGHSDDWHYSVSGLAIGNIDWE